RNQGQERADQQPEKGKTEKQQYGSSRGSINPRALHSERLPLNFGFRLAAHITHFITPNPARRLRSPSVPGASPKAYRSFPRWVHPAQRSSVSCGRSFPSGRNESPTRTRARPSHRKSSSNPAAEGSPRSFPVLLLQKQLGRAIGRNSHHARLVLG